jgi:hypothetical protein
LSQSPLFAYEMVPPFLVDGLKMAPLAALNFGVAAFVEPDDDDEVPEPQPVRASANAVAAANAAIAGRLFMGVTPFLYVIRTARAGQRWN